MPVLTALTSSVRPGKRVSASAAPAGMPMPRASSVAVPETSSESSRIDQTSASPANSRAAACRTPATTRSTGYARNRARKSTAAVVTPPDLAGPRGAPRLRRGVPKAGGLGAISGPPCSKILVFFPGDRHEQRLAVLVHAEGLDDRLSLRGQHEVGERLATGHVDARPVGRVDLHHRV